MALRRSGAINNSRYVEAGGEDEEGRKLSDRLAGVNGPQERLSTGNVI